MIPWHKRSDRIKKVFFLESSCCTQELINLFSSRYDPERLDFMRTDNINEADIFIFNGFTSQALLTSIKKAYDELEYKPLLISVGGCAINKGPLNAPDLSLPVSVFIPGCPPRPESIIDGLLRGLNS